MPALRHPKLQHFQAKKLVAFEPFFWVGDDPPREKGFKEICGILRTRKILQDSSPVVGSNTANAAGTLCLQFPGWSTVLVNLWATRRLAWHWESLSWTLWKKFREIWPPITILSSWSSLYMNWGKRNCLKTSSLLRTFLMRWTGCIVGVRCRHDSRNFDLCWRAGDGRSNLPKFFPERSRQRFSMSS